MTAITVLSNLRYDATSLAHLYLGSFYHSSLQILKLCQVGLGALLHNCFQVSPEMLDRVQAHTLAWPLKDIQRLVPRPEKLVFSWSESPLGADWQTPSGLSVPFTEEWLPSGYSTIMT